MTYRKTYDAENEPHTPFPSRVRELRHPKHGDTEPGVIEPVDVLCANCKDRRCMIIRYAYNPNTHKVRVFYRTICRSCQKKQLRAQRATLHLCGRCLEFVSEGVLRVTMQRPGQKQRSTALHICAECLGQTTWKLRRATLPEGAQVRIEDAFGACLVEVTCG